MLSSVNGYDGSEETLRERKRWAPSGFTTFSQCTPNVGFKFVRRQQKLARLHILGLWVERERENRLIAIVVSDSACILIETYRLCALNCISVHSLVF